MTASHDPTPFPFDAVVGQHDAKLALRLAAIDPLIGGVLLRGDKGSAKTTLARGLAALLGDAPVVELPLGATEDRLVGTLDTRAALVDGDVRFHPGLLADADGGVLYVDEINLLPDHLVDVLLDVAVSGENRVERDAVSHVHPARFVLVGSMNPEEGELRPQLLDRFGLCVTITASLDRGERAEAVRRRLRFDRGETPSKAPVDDDPAGAFRAIRRAVIGDEVIDAAGRLALEVGAQGLRADLALCRAAAALAGWEGRDAATVDDVSRIAPLVLAHRSRRGPFDPPVVPPEALDEAIRHAIHEPDPPESDSPDDMEPPQPASPETDRDGEVGTSATNSSPPTCPVPAPDADRAEPDADPHSPDPPASRVEGGASDRRLAIGSIRRSDEQLRRRPPIPADRGRAAGDRPAGPGDPISVVPTARRIALSGADDNGDVLRTSVRVAKPKHTTVLCVDLSGSMGASDRAEAATGAVLGLVTTAYQQRDRVALVTFRGGGADVTLSPTASVEVARHRLDGLTTGGETPLAEGLSAALGVAQRAGDADTVTIAVLTDGRATGLRDAVDRAIDAATAIRAAGIDAVVLDCESGPTRLGLAVQLADAMGARHVDVHALTAQNLVEAIGR